METTASARRAQTFSSTADILFLFKLVIRSTVRTVSSRSIYDVWRRRRRPMDHSKYITQKLRCLTLLFALKKIVFNICVVTIGTYLVLILYYSLFIYYIIGVFFGHSHSWRHIDCFLGEQAWKTISHFNDVVDLFYLLHINWIDWRLLDGFKANKILVITNMLPH